MRLFNAKIIDRRLEGDTITMASEAWACMLARAEALKFVCFVDQVSTSPTLHVELFGGAIAADLEQSFMTFQYLQSLKVLINQSVSGAATISATFSPADATWPPPKHLFVEATLPGATGAAHIELWVCGRGPQLLEATPPSAATLPALLAAARACEDENRLPARKRVLRQGASLYYPPDLFEPSLKWDR